MTIELASDLEVYRLEQEGDYIDRVLEALGHPEALVTDYSHVSDFMTGATEKEDIKWLEEKSEVLGFEITRSDSIWRLAERLKEGK